MTTKIPVIFIAGAGRSGSTLLDRLLGQSEQLASLGELRHLWVRGLRENQLCGCGSPFSECVFWRAAMEEAFGCRANIKLTEIIRLQKTVDQLANVPTLLGLLRPAPAYRVALHDYSKILAKLYGAIAALTKRTIIDSSKDPSHGLLLAKLPALEMDVIHLIRDSRAVAFSLQRSKERPEIYWRKELMPKLSPLRSAARWSVVNAFSECLANKAKRSFRVIYEDLVSSPRQLMARLAEHLNIPDLASKVRPDGTVSLGLAHTVSGNPMRFVQGDIRLACDDEWERRMPLISRASVTAATWLQLRRYGYLRARSSEDGESLDPQASCGARSGRPRR